VKDEGRTGVEGRETEARSYGEKREEEGVDLSGFATIDR